MPPGRLSILVLAWCGLRHGGLAALRIRDLNPELRELQITSTLSDINGTLIEGPPKTEASTRTVPIPRWLCDEVLSLIAGRGPDERLFTAPEGGPVRGNNWRRRVFDPAVRRAGIATQMPGDVLRPHDLRHTLPCNQARHATQGALELIESGAAMALYNRRFILLVERGMTLPSNLQGLYEVRYEGEGLDYDSTTRLLKAFADFKNSSA